MAKLKAPLLSLGASQQLGKTLVFFNWKGLNVVREYVIPSNPNTAPQVTQRGYLTNAVTRIHEGQARAVNPLDSVDITAYSTLANTRATPRTWFNEVVKQMVDQQVAGDGYPIYTNGSATPASLSLVMQLYSYAAPPDDGSFFYGTSPTAMFNSVPALIAGASISVTIPGLTAGQKYWVQFRPDSGDPVQNADSGIYTGTPTA